MMRIAIALALVGGAAGADPAPKPAPKPALPSPIVVPATALAVPDPPPVPSLRIEAARIAAERFADNWRYPDPEPFVLREGGAWFVGMGHYRPRSGRSAALHGGSAAATMLGEILMSSKSPLAGVGAMLTGATLDAAGADSDRDAEAARPRR